MLVWSTGTIILYQGKASFERQFVYWTVSGGHPVRFLPAGERIRCGVRHSGVPMSRLQWSLKSLDSFEGTSWKIGHDGVCDSVVVGVDTLNIRRRNRPAICDLRYAC